MNRNALASLLTSFVEDGFRYLERQGWKRYSDGITPPDDQDPDQHDERLQAMLYAAQTFRFELTELVDDIPFDRKQ